MQVDELGTLETPIALTNTLNVGLVHDALVTRDGRALRKASMWRCTPSIRLLANATTRSSTTIVDQPRSDEEHVRAAIAKRLQWILTKATSARARARSATGLKGGIGSASRQHRNSRAEPYTLGVLVQSNHGCLEELTVNGRRLGEEIIARRNARTDS